MNKPKESLPWVGLLIVILLMGLALSILVALDLKSVAITALWYFIPSVIVIVGGFWFWDWAAPRDTVSKSDREQEQ